MISRTVWHGWLPSGTWRGPAFTQLGSVSSSRRSQTNAVPRCTPTRNSSGRSVSSWPSPFSQERVIERSGPACVTRASALAKDRVLRLLREQQLLSPSRQPEPARSNLHEGTILTEAPNQMWGTDATATFTETDGAVTVFAAIDHCTAECVGIHVVKKANRFEALEPIRQGVKEYLAGFSAGSAEGLQLRHDHGSVYMSDDFQSEIQFLGIEPSPAFVRQPEGNGCIERFFRTLKEQLLWIRRFHDLERTTRRPGRVPSEVQPRLDRSTSELSHASSSTARFSP